MKKSIHSEEYATFLSVLRDFRVRAKLTQIDLAAGLQKTQSFVSKFERGEIRLDLIQLRTVCQAIGKTLPEFVTELEQRLNQSRQRKRRAD